MLSRVFVGGNRRARSVHPFIAVSVIKMPVRIYQMRDRIVTDTC
jgi:hypothetical protein